MSLSTRVILGSLLTAANNVVTAINPFPTPIHCHNATGYEIPCSTGDNPWADVIGGLGVAAAIGLCIFIARKYCRNRVHAPAPAAPALAAPLLGVHIVEPSVPSPTRRFAAG